MAGSKRNKIKKALSPSSNTPVNSPPDDDGLADELFAQLDSKNPNVQAEAAVVLEQVEMNKAAELESTPGLGSRGRFEARQARKAAAHAQTFTPDDKEADARLEKEAKDEEKQIKAVCDDLGLSMHEINPDGHCLYSAIADQLHVLGILPAEVANYATTRTAASQYIYTHPDDFLPFLPSVDGEDGAGSTDPGMMSPKQFELYCATIRDTGRWGGEPEILALSRAYNVPIHVVQSGNPPVVMHDPIAGQGGDIRDKRAARISYHRRMYGLGEHYNSLRPRNSLTEQIKTFLS